MAEIDVKETLERFAAEGTGRASAPPPAAIRRRRRNRRVRQATGAAVLVAVLVGLAPPVWSALRPAVERPTAPVTRNQRPAPVTDPRQSPAARPKPAPPTAVGGAPAGQVEPEGGSTAAGAKQTAAYFMRLELGMQDPVAGAFKRSGDTATVEVHPKAAGEGGTPTDGPITTVSLQAEANGWYVTGTRTKDILVTSPKAGARVHLRGKALAFEGNVQVRVQANRTGKDPVLGEGFVTGGGDVMRPFNGRVTYRGGSGPGWLVFLTVSEADGQVLQATMVPVTLR